MASRLVSLGRGKPVSKARLVSLSQARQTTSKVDPRLAQELEKIKQEQISVDAKNRAIDEAYKNVIKIADKSYRKHGHLWSARSSRRAGEAFVHAGLSYKEGVKLYRARIDQRDSFNIAQYIRFNKLPTGQKEEVFQKKVQRAVENYTKNLERFKSTQPMKVKVETFEPVTIGKKEKSLEQQKPVSKVESVEARKQKLWEDSLKQLEIAHETGKAEDWAKYTELQKEFTNLGGYGNTGDILYWKYGKKGLKYVSDKITPPFDAAYERVLGSGPDSPTQGLKAFALSRAFVAMPVVREAFGTAYGTRIAAMASDNPFQTYIDIKQGIKDAPWTFGGTVLGAGKADRYLRKPLGKVFGDKRFISADMGEMVPLRERIKQAGDILKGNYETAITSRPSFKSRGTRSNVPHPLDPDFTHNIPHRFATPNIKGTLPTSDIFLTGTQGRIRGIPNLELLRKGQGVVPMKLKPSTISLIQDTLLRNNGKLPSQMRKWLYQEAQNQATALSKRKGERVLVSTLSPKRTAGFHQPELEMSLVFPRGQFKPPKLHFQGFGPQGAVILSQQRFNPVNIIPRSHIKRFWSTIARDKFEYLHDRPAIIGEYAGHGRSHLLKFDAYHPFYKYHDIVKVADVDSFKRFPHGEVAYSLWKKGVFPDKAIYQLPRKQQKLMAEAWAGHEYARFNVRSLFKKPLQEWEIGYKSQYGLPSKKQLYWYIKNKIKSNPYLEDVSTLDRIDLARFGLTPDELFMSKKALERMYGPKWPQVKSELIKEAQAVDTTVSLQHTALTNMKRVEAGMRKYYRFERALFNRYYGADGRYKKYTKPLNYKYGDKEVSYTSYPVKYEDVTVPTKVPETPYFTYSTYSPPGGPPYEPPVLPPRTPFTPKEDKPRGHRRKDKKEKAYQLVFLDSQGKEYPEFLYPNKVEALSEGFIKTDKSPFEHFTIKKAVMKRELLRRGRDSRLNYKFRKKQNIYIERVPYRKDSESEKGFNVIPYVFGNTRH